MSYVEPGAQYCDDDQLVEAFANEERIAQELAGLTGCQLVSFPTYSVVDRLLTKAGIAQALIEVKTRSFPRTKYPTFRIDRYKLETLRALREETHLITTIVVEWSCGSLGSADVAHPLWLLGTDTADLPLSAFHPIRRAE